MGMTGSPGDGIKLDMLKHQKSISGHERYNFIPIKNKKLKI